MFAAAAVPAQDVPSAPGPVSWGRLRFDQNAPGDDRGTRKFVVSHPQALEITWRPPASDGGSPITTYRVHWYETSDYDGTKMSVDVSASGDGLHYHYLTGLTNGVEYGVGVTAVNAVGEGPFVVRGGSLASLPYTRPRDALFINTPSTTYTMEVHNLAVEVHAPNVLRLTWTPPTGTLFLDWYVVRWSSPTSAGALVDSAIVGNSGTSHEIPNLVGGHRYWIAVETESRLTPGSEGVIVTPVLTSATAYGAPAAPGGVGVLGTDGALEVSWTKPDDGGSPILGYRMEWRADGEQAGSAELGPGATAHTIPDLTNGTEYEVRLQARNQYFDGVWATGTDTPFRNSRPDFGDASAGQPVFAVGVPSTLTLPVAGGGDFGLSYSLSPDVPGLTFDAAERTLSGAATTAGEHAMTLRADDGDRFTGDDDAAELSFTLRVQANTAPSASALAKDTPEDTPLTFSAADFRSAFVDPDFQDALKAVSIPTLPDAGALTLDGDATTAGQTIPAASLGGLVFTPAEHHNGTVTFTFTVRDLADADSAAATATITVSPVADPPVANAGEDQLTVPAAATVTLDGSASDPDAGAVLTASWTQTSGTTVTLSDASSLAPTFTAPSPTDSVTLEFRLTVTDETGLSTSDDVTVQVNANNAPVVNERIADVGLRTALGFQRVFLKRFSPEQLLYGEPSYDAFSDPDGDSLTYTATSANPLVATATARWNAAYKSHQVEVEAKSEGIATVTVTATDDDEASASQSFRVLVVTAPDDTVRAAAGVRSARVTWDAPPAWQREVILRYQVRRTRFDPENGGAVEGVWVDVPGSSGETTEYVVPNLPAGQRRRIDVRAVLNEYFVPELVGRYPNLYLPMGGAEVTARASNRPPAATAVIPGQTLAAPSKYNGRTVELADYFSDPDGDALTFTLGTATSHASRELDGSTLKLTAASAGTDTVTVTATDPAGLTAKQSFAVRVEELDSIRLRLHTRGSGESTVHRRLIVLIAEWDSLPGEDRYRARISEVGTGTPASFQSIIPTTAGGVTSLTLHGHLPDSSLLKPGTQYLVEVEHELLGVSGSGTVTTQEGKAEVNEYRRHIWWYPEDGQVTLRWNIHDFLGANARGPLDHIFVRYGRADGDDTTTVEIDVNERGTVIDGLANGVTYEFSAGAAIANTGRNYLLSPHPFQATPRGPNRAPVAVDALPGLLLQLSDPPHRLDLSRSFRDPEGGTLTYAAEASAAGIVDTAVERASLRLTPRAAGSVNLTVTATDDAGNQASQAFDVWVNRPPVSSRWIGTVIVRGESSAGWTNHLFLPAYVTDPDGDPLSFSFTTTGDVAEIALLDSDQGAERAGSGPWLRTRSTRRPGRMTVYVTATDGRGGTLTVPVAVVVLGDARSIWIESPEDSVAEGEAAELTVRLGQAFPEALTVNVSTADGTAAAGSDYTAQTAAAVTIPAGETSATVSVATLDDALVEGEETFSIAVSDPGNLPANVSISSTGASVEATIADADAVSVGITAASESVAEGETATFTVTAAESGAPTADVVVSYELAGAATGGSDYTAPTGTVTIPAEQTAAAIAIQTLKDPVFDPDETLIVKLTGATTAKGAAGVDTPASATTTIAEASVIVASISVDQPPYEGGQVWVHADLSARAEVTVPVNWTYRDVTATADSDYGARKTEGYSFPPGFNGFSTSVSTFADSTVEGDETFEIVLSDEGLPEGVILKPGSATALVTIPDDDTATVTIADASAREGNAIIFTATLDNAVQGGLTVTPEFTDGTATEGDDYTANTSAVVFAGTAGETRRFTVATTRDEEEEADETFTVSLTVSGAPEPVTAAGAATGTITDDDDDGLPTLRIADASAAEGDAITFTVTLDQAVAGGLTVTPGFADVTATAGTDYTENTAALTFAGAADETQSFTVATIEDADEETDETFTVTLTVSGTETAVTADDTATGTIADDDRIPAVTIEDASAVEGNALSFTVTLDHAVPGGLTVTPSFTDVTATKGTDYTENTAALTFAGRAGETRSFAVATTEDTEEETDETFTVGLTVSGTQAAVTAIDTATGAITDPGELGQTIDLTREFTGTSEGGSVTLELALIGERALLPAPRDLTVHWTTFDDTATGGRDYPRATKASATIPAGETSATFQVRTLQDDVVESREFFGIRYEGAEDLPAYLALGANLLDGSRVAIADDDSAALTIGDASADEGGAVTFTVTLDNAVQGGLTVTPSFTDGSAAAGADYTENTGALSFAGTADETQTFRVQTTQDDAVEGDETFTVGLTVSDAPRTVSAADTATGTITDDDGAVLTVADASAAEGESIAFTVKAGAAVPGGFTVTPGFADGTATAGADYTENTAALTFAGTAGETQTFTVATTQDTAVEANETFTVSLAVSGASIDLKATDTGTGTIADDDRAAVTVEDAAATEGGSLTFSVTLDQAVAGGLTVTPRLTDATATAGADYTVNTAPVTFTGAAGETQTFTVATIDDADLEAPETFTVSLAVSGTAAAVTATDTATGTITDDDSAAVTVEDAAAAEGDPLTFTVTLDTEVSGGLTVTPRFRDATATAGADYTENTAALTFAGTAGETQTFTVSTTGDTDLEADETFTVGLTVSGTALNVLASDTATGLIADDDDSAAVTVEDVSAAEGDSLTFTVTLNHAVDGGLTVTPDFADGTAAKAADYTENTAALRFTGTAGETKSFTVTATEDEVVEGDEGFTVSLAVSGTPFDVTAGDTATGTIIDDDTATVAVDDAVAVEGDSLTFTVTLDRAVEGGLTVTPEFTDVTAAKSIDYTENTVALHFRGEAGETRTLTADTIRDDIDEGAETFTVSLRVSDEPGAVTASDTATGTITDEGVVVVTVDDAFAAEGEPLSFTVKLSQSVKDGLTVTPGFTDGTAAKGTDYTENTAPLTFIGNAGEAHTFNVATTDDAVVQADRTFTVGLTVSGASTNVVATDTATGTITNDDTATLGFEPAAVSVEEGGRAAFTVALSKAVASDVTFSWRTADGTAGADDYAAQAATNVTMAPWEASTTLEVQTTQDTAAEPAETFSAAISASGLPAGVTLGAATATVTVTDDDSAAVTIENASADEGDSITFTVTLDRAVAGGFRITPSFTDGTAEEGTDYTENTAALRFAGIEGETHSFAVRTIEDEDAERDETFAVSLSLSGTSAAVDATDTASGRILDDDLAADAASIALSVSPEYIQEGQDAAEVTVTATRDGTDGDHSVALSVGGGTATDGTDYTIWTFPELRIRPGESAASVTLTYTVYTDELDERNESAILSGSAGGATVSDAVITIGDPEDITLSVAPSTIAEDAGDTQVTVTATLDSARDTSTAVTLDLAGSAADPADYAATSPLPTITIPPGQTSADATFTVTPVDDALVEGDETITVNGQSGARPVSPVAITITDNDRPFIALSVSPEYIQEGQHAAQVTVTATRDGTDGDHSVTLSVGGGSATDGSDYTIWTLSEILGIAPGETTASATLTFTVPADELDEGNETVILSGTAAGATVGDAVVTIGDPEDITLSVAPSTIAEDAGATQVAVTATLDSARDTSTAVTLDLAGSAANPADYAASTLPTITIPSGQTSADATFTVTPVDDALVEGDETITVNGRSGSRPVSPGALTITDSDGGPTVTVEDASAGEGDSITFTVTLDRAVSGGLTVTPSFIDVTATEGADYDGNTAALSFTGAGKESKTFTVATTEDEVVEGAETFTVGLTVSGTTATVTATDTATGTITDDDAATLAFDSTAVSVAEGGKASLTVELSKAAANDVTFSWQTADGTAESSDYTAQEATDVTIAAGDTSATLEVATADDELAEAGETFTVTISADALPAGVTLGADATATVTVTDDDSAAVTIADASANEGDAITFTVTLDNAVPDGFTVTPSFTDGTATKGTDYTGNTAGIAFTGAAGETQTFTVSTTEDTDREHHETFTVSLAVTGAAGTVDATDTATGTITDDDGALAAVTIEDVSAAEGDSLTFTVTLDNAVSGGLTVTPSFTDGTAAGGADYTENTAALAFTGTANETQTFTVTTTEDTLVEPDETFTVALSVSGGTAEVTATDTATGTITNDDSATLAFDSAAVSVTEGGAASLTVELSQAASSDVTFSWETADGTADSNDYTAQAATSVTIAAGDTSATLEVQTTPDTVVEAAETFTATISASSLPAGVTLGTDATATVTITEDDSATLAFDSTAVGVTEGGKASLTVELSQEAASDVTFSWQTADGTAGSDDYTAQEATDVTIAAGDTSATLEVQTATDELAEAGETFTVTISASSLPAGVTLGTDATATVTITDDDSAAVTIADASATEGDSITFTATLDKAVPGGLTVTPSFADGTATEGTDYTENTAALTFTGTADETRSFTVATTQDTDKEHHETFTVSLAVTGTSATVTATDTATGTITNDDGALAAVTVEDVSAAEGDSLTFTVTLDNAVSGGLTVTPSFTDGTATKGADYTENTAALTFAGTAGETQTFTVTTAEDTLVEPDETFTVALAVSGSTAEVTATDTATGTITNDDSATLGFDSAAVLVTEGGAASLTVELSTAASSDVTFSWQTADGSAGSSDYTAQAATDVTISAGDTSATLEIQTTQDTVVEAAETFTATISASSLPDGVTLGTATATATITDDDSATMTVADASVSANEGDAVTFTVTLDNAVDGGLTMTPDFSDGTATGGADYTENTEEITFTGTAGETQTVTVETTEDETVEADETFFVKLAVSGTAATVTAPGRVTVTITDDDSAAVTIADASADEGDAITFTVTLDNAVQGGFTVTPGFADRTAAGGTDYTENTTALSFDGAAGETRTFTVATTQDTDKEHHETFTVSLAVTGAAGTVDATDTATGTITDDDGALAAVTIEDVSAAEGDSLTFTVTLDNAVSGGLTVTPRFTDGTATEGIDYTGNTTALTFAGTAGETKTFTVATTEDTLVEPDETFTVALAVSGSTAEVTATDTATGTITNDDAATLGFGSAAVSVTEGGKASLTVELSKEAASDVTFSWQTDEGTAGSSDYTAQAATSVTIAAGDASATLEVQTTDDALAEAGETFTVTISAPSLPAGVTLGTNATATVTITDDDSAAVTIADASANEGDAITFTVTLDNAVPDGFTATPDFNDVTATAETDYTENTAEITFTGTAGETQTITVATAEDETVEADETFIVKLAVSGTTAKLTAPGRAFGTISDDDSAAVTVADASADEGDAITFTVTLDNAVQGGFTVTPGFADRTAAGGTDYTENTAALTFAGTANETQSFTVATTQDTDKEHHETFTVSLAVTGAAGTVDATDTATGTIADDDGALAAVTVADVSANEGDSLTFTVTLNNAVSGGLTVTPSFTDGTATSGTDYTENTAALNFAGTAGEAQTFTVATTEDTVVEADETFTVALAVSGSTAEVTATDTATGTITNDDSAALGFNAAAVSVTEGGKASLTVELTKAAASDVTFSWETADGTAGSSDYTAQAATSVTIAAGDTSATLEVQTTEDTLAEAGETFTVTISAPSLPAGVTLGTNATATVTITDDDSAAVTVADASANEGDAITFTVTLDNAVAGGFTVTPSFTGGTATGGTDYTGNTAALTFTGTAGETQTFTVATTEDTVVEPDETFTVALEVSGSTAEVTATDTATGTITNDDAATLGFDPATASVTEGGKASFTVKLSQQAAGDVTFSWSTADGTADASDYTARAATNVTIAAGDTSATLEVQTTQDTAVEGSETFTATITASSLPDGVTLGTATATATIGDDDSAALTVADASADEGDSITFTVTLDKAVAGGLTVTPSFTDGTATGGTDYTENTSGLAFTGTAEETRTFIVATTEDTVVEPDETFTVALAVSGTAAAVTATDTAVGTITNDDSATVSLVLTPDSIGENGGASTVTATMSATASVDVTVAVAAAPVSPAVAADFTQTGTELTIAAGATASTGTMTIAAVDNDVAAAEREVTVSGTVSGAAGVSDPAVQTLTITEDDAAALAFDSTAVSVAEGGEASLTVELSKAAASDVTFSWETADGTAGSSDYTAQAATSVTIAAGDTSGTLKVATDDDELAEAGETFTVTISAPSLPSGVTLGADAAATVTITDDDSAELTIADASADEGDSITFTVTLDNAVQGGFTVTPSFTDGTATEGTDYTGNTGALSFTGTAGETHTFTVATIEDTDEEDAETFTVGLAISETSATVTATDTATGTIHSRLLESPSPGDTAAVTVADASASEGEPMTFTVTLDQAVSGGLTVTPHFTDGTATKGIDYTENTAALTFAGTAGETHSFTVSTTADTAEESDETFTVGLTVSGTTVTVTDSDTAIGTIRNDDEFERAGTTPRVTIEDARAEEGDELTFTVTLDLPVQGGFTVTPGFTDGTATKGIDYTENTTALTFAGNTGETHSFTVSTTEDTDEETDETFTVSLVVSGESETVTATDTATGTITNDDDDGVPTLRIADASATEGDAITFSVTLDQAVSGGLTVTPDFTDGTAIEGADYTENTAALTFAGTKGETQSFNVPTTEDTDAEPDETFTVSLTVSETSATVTATDTATGTITDDDEVSEPRHPSGVRIADASATEGDPLTFTVTLSHAVQGGLRVTPSYTDGTATEGADYTGNTAALTFAGTAGETQSFIVSTIDDEDEEPDETFTVSLRVSDSSETVLATGSATGTITDDDDDGVPTLRIADASASEGDAIAFAVSLDQAVSGGLTVTPSFSDGTATKGTDYTENTAALSFAGNAGETHSFTVSTTQDADEEPDETFTVGLTVTGNSETVTATDTATGTIVDDDRPSSGVTLGFDRAAITVTEGGTAVLTVLLSASVASDVTFTCRTVDGTATAADKDYTPTEETVTIKAGDTTPSSPMRIPILRDALVEGDETFTATISADNLPEDVSLGTNPATITIRDPAPQRPPAEPIEFGQNHYVFHLEENRSGLDRPVYLGNVRAEDGATYEMVRGDGNRFAISSGSGLVRYIGPGEDYESGPNEFELEVRASNGESTATVFVLVRVVNVPEAPEAGDDRAETPEDVAVVIDVLANDRDPDGDRLSVTAVSTPKHGTVTVEDAGVRYESELNWFGEDSFAYTVSDPGGLTDQATVRVTVTPVNDPPAAVDDEAETPEDVPVIVDVLANDTDVDGDPLRIVAVGAPGNGTTAIVAGGVIYASAPDWNGTDRFTYTIADPDGLEDTATVTMTVIPVNDPPVAVGVIPDQALEEGGTEVILNLTEYFNDVDGDVLTYVAESSDETAVTVGVFGPVLTLTPVVTGGATITVTATDAEGLTATQTFGVRVGDEAVRGVLTDAFAALGRAHLSSSRLTIGRRLEAGGGGATRLMLAGQHLSLDTWERIGAGGLRQSQEVLLRAETYRQRTSPLNPFGLMEPWPESPVSSGNTGGAGDWRDRLLRGTDLLMSFGGGDEPAGGGRWTVWGQGDVQTFAGSPGESVNYDGDLRTAYVGVDTKLSSRWLAGVALSRSTGGSDWTVGPSAGRLGTVLTTVHPYVRWSGAGTTVAAMAGIGRGTSENTRTLVDRSESSGLSLGLGLVDARRNLATTGGGLQIDLRGEAAWARLGTGAGEESVDRLAAGVHRLRTGLEAQLSLKGPAGLQITPFGAVSTRRDGGAGQTGFGLEVAGGFRMSGGPVRLDAQGRMLALHTADEYRERGVSLTATVGGGQYEPGLSASLRPRWGAPGMGAETLWQDQFQSYTQGDLRSDAGVDGRIGYGMRLPHGLLLTPFGGYGQTGHGRRIQFGANLGMVGRFSGALDSPVQIEFVGERSTRPEGAADLRMSLHGVLNFGSSPREVPEAPTRGPNTIRQAGKPQPE